MRIPATVVTGFLGAGKTSLIRHLVEHAGGKRLALLINEFGDLGVDRAILGGCGIPDCREEDVIELANGCICCTVADDFLPAMRTILAREPAPDHIVIETSGLALPKPLVAGLRLARGAHPGDRRRGAGGGRRRRRCWPGGSPTDPAALCSAQRAADPALRTTRRPLEELFEEQLGCADLVLVNKADQIAVDDRAAVEAAIRPHLRPSCGFCGPATAGSIRSWPWAWASVPRTIWPAGRRTMTTARSTGTTTSRASSSRCRRWRTRPWSRRGCATRSSGHDILRVKGFLAVGGKPLRQVVAGGGRAGRALLRPSLAVGRGAAREPRRDRAAGAGSGGDPCRHPGRDGGLRAPW